MTRAFEFLTDIPLFADLSDREAKKFLHAATRKAFPANQTIYLSGQNIGFFGILTDGLAKSAVSGFDGREFLFDFSFPGDTVGELNVSAIAECPFDLTTIEPSEFIFISRGAMIDLVKDNGNVAFRLAGAASERALRLHRRLRSLALERGHQRIIALLVDIAHRIGRSTSQGILIDIGISHQTIADACGFTRETVTRLLSELAVDGQIKRTPSGWLLTLDCTNQEINGLGTQSG